MMICSIIDKDGNVRLEDREPICGEDFCDTCGDCLSCYGDDPCLDGGEHTWIIYEEGR